MMNNVYVKDDELVVSALNTLSVLCPDNSVEQWPMIRPLVTSIDAFAIEMDLFRSKAQREHARELLSVIKTLDNRYNKR